jgi:hypothetical protein
MMVYVYVLLQCNYSSLHIYKYARTFIHKCYSHVFTNAANSQEGPRRREITTTTMAS